MKKSSFIEAMSSLCARLGSHLPSLKPKLTDDIHFETPYIGSHLPSFKPKLTESEIEELSLEFFEAAKENDVARMKKLRKKGADIHHKAYVTFTESESYIHTHTWDTKDEKSTNLMTALHAGAYNAALYLIQEKVDATFSHQNSDWEKALNALDHLITADNPATDPDEGPSFYGSKTSSKEKGKIDLFTPEQRVTLFKAMVENTPNPLDLVSDKTMDNVIQYGRAELIPGLVGIGVKITNRHFVDAAHPYSHPHTAIPMLEALLPYVKDVNVTAFENGPNAGHEAAAAYDLPTFMWLEERGLHKYAFAGAINVPTYAHNLVRDGFRHPTAEKRLTFANHLKEKGYPLDIPTTSHYLSLNTPTDLAFHEGQFELGLFYLKAGTTRDPKQLGYAATCLHYNGVTAKDLLKLFDDFKAEGFLSQEAMQAAFDSASHWSGVNEHSAKAYQPVIDSLLKHGLTLKGKDAALAQKLLENYVPEKTAGGKTSHQLPQCARH